MMEKTRNIQRTNTLAQNVISPITATSSSEVASKLPLRRQNSNRSESKIAVKVAAGDKRQSSSDSTNDLSLRKFTMTVQSG